MKYTWEEIVKLAVESGFVPYADTNLSGQNERDSSISVGEYPTGESLEMLLKKLGIEIADEEQPVKI